jgi:hypothetical protein
MNFLISGLMGIVCTSTGLILGFILANLSLRIK